MPLPLSCGGVSVWGTGWGGTGSWVGRKPASPSRAGHAELRVGVGSRRLVRQGSLEAKGSFSDKGHWLHELFLLGPSSPFLENTGYTYEGVHQCASSILCPCYAPLEIRVGV